jgi:hypothetical protein
MQIKGSKYTIFGTHHTHTHTQPATHSSLIQKHIYSLLLEKD